MRSELRRRLAGLERRFGKALEESEPIVVVECLVGYTLPEECKEVLLAQEEAKNPRATHYFLGAHERDGRCRACGQYHVDPDWAWARQAERANTHSS